MASALGEGGVDLAALGLAWARVMPVVTLVPAFGLRALPTAARAVLSLALALAIFPAMQGAHGSLISPHIAWPMALLLEALRGLPVAIAAAVPLWAATQAGGLVDTLRGGQGELSVPVVEGKTSSIGVLFALLAGALFLKTGGPAHITHALASGALEAHPVIAVVRALDQGIHISLAIAAPMLGASIIVEVATALIARSASPAQIHALLGPLRSGTILFVLALATERISRLMESLFA